MSAQSPRGPQSRGSSIVWLVLLIGVLGIAWFSYSLGESRGSRSVTPTVTSRTTELPLQEIERIPNSESEPKLYLGDDGGYPDPAEVDQWYLSFQATDAFEAHESDIAERAYSQTWEAELATQEVQYYEVKATDYREGMATALFEEMQAEKSLVDEEATEWARESAEISAQRTQHPPELASPTHPVTLTCSDGGCTAYPTWCDPAIKGNIAFESREKIYHLPGQVFYEATVISPEYGERWFCSEEEAIAAGWRKSSE